MEIIKMQRWLTVRPGRKLTQRFVINWLNKCDKKITIGDICKNYKTGEAWRMIIESILRNLKRGMDKKRFRVRGKQ